MRVADIDMQGDIWVYCPPAHKGAWRGHRRTIYFSKNEQAIIARRIDGKTSADYVFSPHDTMRELFPHRKINPRIHRFYNSHAYERSISRAIKKANSQGYAIPYWTPYQLRHAGISETVERCGIDEARAVAGHASTAVTNRYNHRDGQIAYRNAMTRSEMPFCGHFAIKTVQISAQTPSAIKLKVYYGE